MSLSKTLYISFAINMFNPGRDPFLQSIKSDSNALGFVMRRLIG